MRLPQLSAETHAKSIEKILKIIFTRLGAKGIKAMRDYIDKCGLAQDGAVCKLMKAFAEDIGSKQPGSRKSGK
jgi:hypothetical protein